MWCGEYELCFKTYEVLQEFNRVIFIVACLPIVLSILTQLLLDDPSFQKCHMTCLFDLTTHRATELNHVKRKGSLLRLQEGEINRGFQHGVPRTATATREERSAEARQKELKEIAQYQRLVQEVNAKVVAIR